MITLDMFSQFGSMLASVMFFWAMYQHYLPSKIREVIEFYASRYTYKLVNYFSPYLAITFAEYPNDRVNRSEVYTNIETCLSDNSSTVFVSNKGSRPESNPKSKGKESEYANSNQW
uniref:AAA-type ATPase N-terminal domain-containing protein n=1 Tax=Opuntia streptacantha TaxID=393608 RepID=A0A7C9DT86_OPUST